MLNWLKGDKVDHPLADARHAKKVIEEFPANDLWQRLEDANYWLDSINATPGFKLDQRFELIDQLDLATRKAQEALLDTYNGLGEHDKVQEKRIWKTVTDFWNGAAAGYLACAAQAQDAKNVGAAMKQNLPIIAARGMRALRHQMKWVLIRYGMVRPEIWSEIARYSVFAEAGGFADKPVAIYPGSAPGSVRHEFVRVMMLWASSPSGLSPLEQDVAERIVVHLTPKFRFDMKQWDGCDYCFDLDGMRPPLRVMRSTPITGNTRFFDANEARQAAQAMLSLVTSTGTMPAGVELPAGADAVVGIKVLKHLLFNWAKEMPPRAHERRRTAMTLHVVHGYQNVQGAVAPELSEGLDFSGTLAHDTWVAEDVSAGGFGVIVPAGKGEWLKVGVLVGVRSETESSWSMGVIRRVKSDEHRQLHIGIQLLSKTALLVSLRTLNAVEQQGKRQAAILLSAQPSPNGSLHVIARRDLFNGAEPLEAMYGNPPHTVMLEAAGVLESGDDFDWLRYTLSQPIS
jgi:cyclic-di-GMP-binding protein